MNTRTRYTITGFFALAALSLTGCASSNGETAAIPTSTASASTPTPTPVDKSGRPPKGYYDNEAADASAEAAEAEAERDALLADSKINADYKDVAQDASDLFQLAIDAMEDNDVAAFTDLGPDFARLGLKGAALKDMPDAGRAANKAWDDAMSDMLVAGGSMQTGMISMATDAMLSVGENIELAQAYIDN